MVRRDHIRAIEELSASERVFTTAQAARLGIPRDTLAKACASGRLVRVTHGAYRMAGVPSLETDELVATWKMTDAPAFTHERMAPGSWDGIAVAGSTAASLLGIGDFYLSPYVLIAPRRMRSRMAGLAFSMGRVDRGDISFLEGLPVTRLERTILDLALLGEDPSLVRDALADARSLGLDEGRLRRLVEGCGGPVTVARASRIILGSDTWR